MFSSMNLLQTPRTTPSRRGALLALEQLEPRLVLDSAANISFLNSAFGDLLARLPDPVGLSFFTSLLDRGVSRQAVSLAIQASPEHQALLVNAEYVQFLHRAADAQGLQTSRNFLASGGTTEQLAAMLTGSAEYFLTRGGGTTPGYLQALFQDALGRDIDFATLATLNGLLSAGVSRELVSATIFVSPEFKQVLVQSVFQEFLGRDADPGGLSVFVTALNLGARREDVLAQVQASAEYSAPAPAANFTTSTLTAEDAGRLLDRASAATASQDAIIVIVDRGGRILGVRVEDLVSPGLVGNPAGLTFAVDGALAKARTGAFFGNDQAPLTSRTIRYISQTTITQREVESNPSITDPNSTLRGPGFVAPVGIGGHFPPGVPFTPQVDLFAIEHTNRDSIVHPGPDGIKGTFDDITLQERFNVDPAEIPATVPLDEQLLPPESYGFVSGIMPTAQSRGIATLPGGIPIYKKGPDNLFHVAGGIGVFFPGTTGFASEENSILGTNFNAALPDRSLEAEYIAFAALGGSPGAGLPIGDLGGLKPVADITLPFGRLDLVGVTLDVFGPGGTQGPLYLVTHGINLGPGVVNGVNQRVVAGNGADGIPNTADELLLNGTPVPEGWLVTPHDGVGISAGDVIQIINQGILQANRTRAAIRLPLDSRSRMVFAVTDRTGEVLGLYRMPDATVFSIDVAVAKARNVAYYDDATALQPEDQLQGIAAGTAFTNRTFRYLALPRFPEGIEGKPPGPFSILTDGGVNPNTGLNIGPALPASAYDSIQGHDAFNPGTNFHATTNVANQNGIVFFPGASPLYKTINGFSILVGGFGVSGDGVDQDDVVTIAGAVGYAAPDALKVDRYFFQGIRLPYMKFNRNPEG